MIPPLIQIPVFERHLALENEVHNTRSALDDRDEVSTSTRVGVTENLKIDHGRASHSHFEADSEFTCGTCKKVFLTNSQLEKHASVHDSSRKFLCDDCSVSFRTEGRLRTHFLSEGHKDTVRLRQAHSQEPTVAAEGEDRRNSSSMMIMCELCGFMAKSKNKHREKYDHIYMNHFKEKLDKILPRDSPFSCPRGKCDHCAKDKLSLIRHYVCKHGVWLHPSL